MSAPLLIGTNVVVGFNGVNYTGMVCDSADESRGATMKDILDENMATMTHLVTNAYRDYKVTGKVLATNLATVRAICVGNTVSINTTNCVVFAPTDIKFNGLEAIATISVRKYDSMTYT